jgi:hypothetical protein
MALHPGLRALKGAGVRDIAVGGDDGDAELVHLEDAAHTPACRNWLCTWNMGGGTQQ